MKAKNIMTTKIFTVNPESTVHDIAVLMDEKGVSAVPVIDRSGVVGIVSEGDLIHRKELGAERFRSRTSWLRIYNGADARSDKAFQLKDQGLSARSVMTTDVITVSEDASIGEVADRMESHNIKRLLVMSGAKLIGIISRADIVRALAARPEGAQAPVASDDDEIRYAVIETLEQIPGTSPWLNTVIVSNGIVWLYGTVEDEKARSPSQAAVQALPHVKEVRDHRSVLQPY